MPLELLSKVKLGLDSRLKGCKSGEPLLKVKLGLDSRLKLLKVKLGLDSRLKGFKSLELLLKVKLGVDSKLKGALVELLLKVKPGRLKGALSLHMCGAGCLAGTAVGGAACTMRLSNASCVIRRCSAMKMAVCCSC